MRNRVAIVLSIIALCSVAAVIAVSVHRTLKKPVNDEVILFRAYCNGSERLFAINPDGSDFRLVTWKMPRDITFSPDGRYSADVQDNKVYLKGPAGKRQLEVPAGNIDTPVFSPDSRMIGIISHDDNYTRSRFVIENVDGSGRHLFSIRQGYGLAFSPDRKHIAFYAGESPNEYVYISDDYGCNNRMLAAGDSPVFSPDGKTIAFTSQRGENQDLVYLIDLDGKHERLFSKDNSRAFYPLFSPDGKKVIFRGEESDNPDIGLYMIDIDGKNQRKLSRGPLMSDAIFSPDGKKIAFSNDYGLFIAPVNGGKAWLLTAHGGGDLYWGPIRHLPSESRPSFAGLPKYYYADQLVAVDFDGDGKKEQACTAGPAVPYIFAPSGGASDPLLVLVSRDNKLVARIPYKYENAISNLKAIDLTGDGVPELTYNVETYGASDEQVSFYAHQWTDLGLANMLKTPGGMFSHMSLGNVVALNNGPRKPSTLVLYDFIWGENEAHYSPHRYWAEWYELRNGKFIRTARGETKHKYDGGNPLSAFGIKVPSATVQVL